MAVHFKLNMFKRALFFVLLVAGVLYLFAPLVYEKCSVEYQAIFYGFLYNVYAFWFIVGLIFIFISTFLWNKLFYRSFIAYVFWTLMILILLSVILASFNSARYKSRDGRRITDLKQLQLALDLYFDGLTGTQYLYPKQLEELAPVAMPQIPKDPLGADYIYKVSTDRKFYVLAALLGDDEYGNACYTKVRSRMAGVFKQDIDGEVLGVQCDDPVYCLTP